MPSACCCSTFSLSHILTCRIMVLGGVFRFSLESDTHPAVGFVGPLEALSCYGFGEYEKSGAIATDGVQTFNQQIVLEVEHESQTRGSQKAAVKEQVTLRLDPEILAHYRA